MDNESGARVQENYRKRVKSYGHTTRMRAEHIPVVRIMHIVRGTLAVDTPGQSRRGRPNLRWTAACRRDMREPGLEEDNTRKRQQS